MHALSSVVPLWARLNAKKALVCSLTILDNKEFVLSLSRSPSPPLSRARVRSLNRSEKETVTHWSCLCVVACQAQYIVGEGLAGAMFWSMDYDDFTGQYCDDGAYPLLRRVRAVLSGAPGKHQQMLMRCVCVCVCVCVCFH